MALRRRARGRRAGAALPARGRLAHRRALRRRPRAPDPPGAAARRRRRSCARGARDRAHRLPHERGPLGVPRDRACPRARRDGHVRRRGDRARTQHVGLHDAHAGPGGQRGLRRRARAALSGRPRRRRGPLRRRPARARAGGRGGRRRGRLRPDPACTPLLGVCERRLRAARRGRARDVGAALAGDGASDRARHERRPSRHLARPRARRPAPLRRRASRGTSRRGGLGGCARPRPERRSGACTRGSSSASPLAPGSIRRR